MRVSFSILVVAAAAHADSPAAESAKQLFASQQYEQAITVAATACDRADTDACVQGLVMLDQRVVATRLPTATIASRRKQLEDRLDQQCAQIAASCTALARRAGRDPARAHALYAKGCDGGDLAACVVVARAAPDAQARELLERACTGHIVDGCVALADRIAAHDPARAMSLWNDACAADDSTGCMRAGVAAKRAGQRDAAREAFDHACTLDHGTVCVDAAALAEATRARELLQLGCDDKEPTSCAALGEAIALGRGGARDWTGGLALVQKSCDLVATATCPRLKALLAHPPDGRCATEDACKALCDQHVPHSCFTLGTLLAKRDACDDAATAYATACDGGDAVGCRRRAMIEAFDSPDALQRACRAGDAKSCRIIDRGDPARIHELCTKDRDDIACIQDAGVASLAAAKRGCAHGIGWACFQAAEEMRPSCGWTDDDNGHSIGGCDPEDTPANHALAKQLANRGCDLGNPEACTLAGRPAPAGTCNVDRQLWQ